MLTKSLGIHWEWFDGLVSVDLEMEAMLRKCLRGDEEVGAEGDQKQQAGGGTNCEVVKRLELLKHKLPLYPTVKSYAKLNHC